MRTWRAACWVCHWGRIPSLNNSLHLCSLKILCINYLLACSLWIVSNRHTDLFFIRNNNTNTARYQDVMVLIHCKSLSYSWLFCCVLGQVHNLSTVKINKTRESYYKLFSFTSDVAIQCASAVTSYICFLHPQLCSILCEIVHCILH